MYTGTYFGAKFVNHVYEPTETATAHLLVEFKHKWSVGQYVRFRERHKRTDADTIKEIAYSTEKCGGGTIKVYKLRNKWVGESCIKALMQ
jgi:hypothetical protein